MTQMHLEMKLCYTLTAIYCISYQVLVLTEAEPLSNTNGKRVTRDTHVNSFKMSSVNCEHLKYLNTVSVRPPIGIMYVTELVYKSDVVSLA